MAAITELDYSNGNNTRASATDTDISAGGNFGDFIEVALTAPEIPDDYVLILFQSNGEVAAIIRFDAFATLNSYPGPNGQQIFVFGSSVVQTTLSGGAYAGQSTANWNKIDLGTFTPGSSYAAGTSYAAGSYSSSNPISGMGNTNSGLRHFINGSSNPVDNTSESRHIMLLNDATGQVVDFYSLGATPSIVAGAGAPGAGAVSTVVSNVGLDSVNFAHYAGGGSGSAGPQALVQNPGEIVCFASGTRILTDQGYRPIEALRVGDLIKTLDDDLQELRWLGAQRVRADGALAPVFIPAGIVDNTRPLLVSPLHRFVLNDPWVELATGIPDCLVAAKHMIGYHGIRSLERSEIVYWHLLMDRHQLIWADGALAESFFPGPLAFSSIDAAVQAEILALFPELAYDSERGYGRLVRPPANRGECLMVMDNMTPSILRDLNSD